ADCDFLEANAMSFGERSAQSIGPAVRVAVQLRLGTLECHACLRKRPQRPLVGRKLHDSFEAELALNLLDGLTRFVRDDVCERATEKARGKLPGYDCEASSADFLRQTQSTPPTAASIDAIAPLFRPAWSPDPGTAVFAFCFPNAFSTLHTPQPSRALRRLKIDIAAPFAARA